MRKMMALLLIGLCVGCAKQVKAPPVAIAPAAAQPPSTPAVDLSKVQHTPLSKSMPTAEAAMTGESTVKVASAVEAGLLESQPVRVSYPTEAKARHLSGNVVFHAIIAADGTVKGLTVTEAADPLFVPNAIAAVRSWHYKPYLLNGGPVAVDTSITVVFTLAS